MWSACSHRHRHNSMRLPAAEILVELAKHTAERASLFLDGFRVSRLIN